MSWLPAKVMIFLMGAIALAADMADILRHNVSPNGMYTETDCKMICRCFFGSFS